MVWTLQSHGAQLQDHVLQFRPTWGENLHLPSKPSLTFKCDQAIIPKDIRELPAFITAYGEFTCKPKFGVYMEGELKGVVNGADYTKIEDLVNKYIPSIEKE